MLDSEIIIENTWDSDERGADEDGVEGFSREGAVAAICSEAILGLILYEFLPLDGLIWLYFY